MKRRTNRSTVGVGLAVSIGWLSAFADPIPLQAQTEMDERSSPQSSTTAEPTLSNPPPDPLSNNPAAEGAAAETTTPTTDGIDADGAVHELPPLTIVVKAARKPAGKPNARAGSSSLPPPPTSLPTPTVDATAESVLTGWPTGGQTATGPVDGYIATVSATGTKTGTPILETPQGISVVTQQQIQQQGARTVSDALSYTSGIRADGWGFDTVGTQFNIRGFDSAAFDGLYRDGMKTSSDMQPEPFGLERLDVLKGPASVLYGSAPPGGIVNMVSKRPLTARHAEVNAEYGNFDRLQGSADLGGPVGSSSNLFYRMTMVLRDSNTQVDFVPDDRIYIAPALTWKPSKATSFTYLGYYQGDRNQYVVDAPTVGSLLPNPPYGRVPVSNYLGQAYWDGRENTVLSSGYEFEHAFNKSLSVRQSLRYTNLDVRNHWTYPLEQLSPTTVSLYSTNAPYTDEMFTVDTHGALKWKNGPKLSHVFLFGTDYRYGNRADEYWDTLSGTQDFYDPRYLRHLDPLIHYEDNGAILNQLGFYLQEQAKVGEHWVFLLGGRWDSADTENYAIDFTTPQPSKTTTIQKDDPFTWRGGVTYVFDNGLAPYFSYATSFEPTWGFDRLNRPFVPTTGEQYEAGVKYQPRNMQSFVTLSAFDITRMNVLTTDPINPNYQTQTGAVRSRGFEAEGTLNLTTGLKAIASYSFTEAIVTESEIPGEVGTYFNGVPLHMASAWVLYEFQSSKLKGLGLGGGVRFIGESFNALNTLTIPEYTLVDARVQYDSGAWQFSVNGRNIFDEVYVASCGLFDPDPAVFNYCRYGATRTLVANARYRW